MGGCTSKDFTNEPAKTHKANVSAWKSADELNDFESLFPSGTNSALSRNLTKEIWEEYKDKCDSAGVSFKVCVFSGVKNLDSGIGLYAGSHDSYKTFCKLFDKVVQEYHGHAPDALHKSDMSSEGLVNDELPEDEQAMIISTRIRVGRNLADYPLGPGVTKDQRLEIMNKVVQAATTFEDDLKGTFYPLEGMDAKVQ